MTLQSSGMISMKDIYKEEYKKEPVRMMSKNANLNNRRFRILCNKLSGTLKFSDFYGVVNAKKFLLSRSFKNIRRDTVYAMRKSFIMDTLSPAGEDSSFYNSDNIAKHIDTLKLARTYTKQQEGIYKNIDYIELIFERDFNGVNEYTIWLFLDNFIDKKKSKFIKMFTAIKTNDKFYRDENPCLYSEDTTIIDSIQSNYKKLKPFTLEELLNLNPNTSLWDSLKIDMYIYESK